MASNSKKKKEEKIEPQTVKLEPVEETVSLEAVVAESKEQLAGEEMPLPKKKDPRGRKSNEEKARLEAEAASKRIEDNKQFVAQFAPALRFVVAIPFDYAAKRTSFPGYALTEEEKGALSNQLDTVLERYLPQLPPEHAPLIVFSTSLLVIGCGKMLEHARWKAEQINNKKPDALATN